MKVTYVKEATTIEIKSFTFDIQNIQPLQTTALVQYVERQGISKEIATKYLKEVCYKNTDGKTHFALCFQNDKNGFELRNESFKGSTSPKTITTIEVRHSNVLDIFENFFDFLRALQYYELKTPNNTTVILNSLSHFYKILPEFQKYQKINLFLDNNSISVHNYAAKLYPENKDFNEFFNSNK